MSVPTHMRENGTQSIIAIREAAFKSSNASEPITDLESTNSKVEENRHNELFPCPHKCVIAELKPQNQTEAVF